MNRFDCKTECKHYFLWNQYWGNREGKVLTISGLLEVDVGISQRTPGDDFAAHANRQHWSGGRELFEKHRLRDVRMQITHVQRRHDCMCVGFEGVPSLGSGVGGDTHAAHKVSHTEENGRRGTIGTARRDDYFCDFFLRFLTDFYVFFFSFFC